MGERLLFDLEANSLPETVTKLHCIVVKSLETGEMDIYYDKDIYPGIEMEPTGSIEEGVERLYSADEIIAHNVIGYDWLVLQKLFPVARKPKITDTLILSQMFWPNEYHDHSIEARGKEIGIPKPKHEDWTKLSTDMLKRCIIDVRILDYLWQKCDEEWKSYPGWTGPIQFEHEVYQTLVDSGQYWPIDTKVLDETLEKARNRSEMALERLKELHGGSVSGHSSKPRTANPEDVMAVVPLYTKSGKINSRAQKWIDEHYSGDISKFQGDFSRVFYHDFNPGSPDQVREWFTSLGWKPKMFTYETDEYGKPLKQSGEKIVKNASTSNDPLIGLPEDIKEVYREYKDTTKVLTSYLNKWKETQILVNGIPSLRLSALTCKTVTARWGHRGIANIPAKGALFGEEIRSIFITRPGYTLVGCDASQLEAMVEGHFCQYFDNGARLKAIQEEDVHQKLADKLGVDRKTSKALGYGFAYGAGPKKVSEMLEISLDEAKEMHRKYKEARWEIYALADHIEKGMIKRGMVEVKRKRIAPNKFIDVTSITDPRAYIKGIDGRKIFIRRLYQVNNSLIQSTGAILMKWAYIECAKRLKEEGLDARVILLMHDEYQIEARDDGKTPQRVAEIANQCIEDASKHFKLNCIIKGDPKIGRNWHECH